MNILCEIIVVLLCTAGALAVGWIIFGTLVTPLPEDCVHTVITAQGDGEALERAIQGLKWQRSGLPGTPVIILDQGLTSRGLSVVEALMREGTDLILCPPEQLSHVLQKTEERETR